MLVVTACYCDAKADSGQSWHDAYHVGARERGVNHVERPAIHCWLHESSPTGDQLGCFRHQFFWSGITITVTARSISRFIDNQDYGTRRALGGSVALAHNSLRGDTGDTAWQGDELCAHSKAGWET